MGSRKTDLRASRPKNAKQRSSKPPHSSWSWLKPVIEAAKPLPLPLLFVILLVILVIVAGVVWSALPESLLRNILVSLIAFLVVGGFGVMVWLERRKLPISPSQPERVLPREKLTQQEQLQTSFENKPKLQRLSPEALRDLYLRKIWDECFTLKTTTFKAATGQEAPELELSAIFTDLDIVGTGTEETHRKALQGERRQPVLAAVSSHSKLVLLGDPGSGKSTLVDFLSLCLAGDELRDSSINLKRLGSAWTLPRLLPVRIILRDYAARGLPQAKDLWQFVQDELAAVPIAEGGSLVACAEIIYQALQENSGAILLLDGVDEVPDAHDRRHQLKEAIEQFARNFPRCRILATSRPYAYQKSEEHFVGFEQRELADFSLEQMMAFIERWYRHVGVKDRRLGPEKAADYAEKLKREVQNRERLQDLAANPLLMALMAWLHRQGEGGALPEKRQLLYDMKRA